MDNDQIVSRMNTYLHTSANVLAEWLGKLLPRTSDVWWEDCVMVKLSYNQAEMVSSAMDKAKTEYRKYQTLTLSPIEKEYLENIKDISKKAKRKK